MKNINQVIKIIIGVILCILLGVWIGLTYDSMPPAETISNIPSRPDNSRPMYYDFNDEEWRYITRGNPRANGVNSTFKPSINEEELQDYLEENVDGYLEDTYWGGGDEDIY